MKFTYPNILVFPILIDSPNAIACSFDTDCGVGGKPSPGGGNYQCGERS